MELSLKSVTFQGPEIDDVEFLAGLPSLLSGLLSAINGYVQFHGGLHVRGICSQLGWHSLQEALEGDNALHRYYDCVSKTDIPFAQDCVGDQFILRSEVVFRLHAETGELESLNVDLSKFLERANADPIDFLSLQPLIQLHNEGGSLEPGQQIHVYPPYCTKEAANGVSVRSVPASELLEFHASFAAKLPADGTKVEIKVSR